MKRFCLWMALILALVLALGAFPAALADDEAQTLELTAQFELTITPDGADASETTDEILPEDEGEEADLPDGEEEPEVDEEAETKAPAPAFTADVRIELVNTGDIYFGDEVTLRAVVEKANAAYTLRWEVLVNDEWTPIEDETEAEYTFIVSEENATSEYRVVVIPQL